MSMAARIARGIDNGTAAGKGAKIRRLSKRRAASLWCGVILNQPVARGPSRPAQAFRPGADPLMRAATLNLNFRHVAIALAALTAIRIAGLYLSQVDFFMDEAQYWAWSRELAWGYFSKPPLLAWIIAGTDAVCGSGEACTRAVSPLLYFATCLLLYGIAAALYDRKTAAWTALTFALATGVSFSARIISTDVPLIFFWTLALFAYVKLLRAPDWRWVILLGIALGLGLLAKYAMIYFLLCAVCAAAVERDACALIKRPQTWGVLAIAVIIVAPNIYWNVANHFVTFHHTGHNITGSGFHFNFTAPFEFIAAQFGLPGPLVFAAFLAIVAQIGRTRLAREDRLMLAFALPVLTLIVALALLRPPNANWAAPAIVSLTILVVAWWVRSGYWRLIEITLVIGLCAQAALLAGDADAYRISVPLFGKPMDVYHRTLGWRALGPAAAQLARQANAKTVVAESRDDVAALIYDLRDEPLRVLTWPSAGPPRDGFDLTHRFTDAAAEPVLMISACASPNRLKQYFADVTPLGTIVTQAGPHTERRYYAFALSRRLRPIGPLGGC
jgi:Dolichyl-phosphate-mannose-protein mannosyltransferase